MPVSSEPKIADVIRPVLEDRGDLRGETSQEDVPKFVTREAIQPRNAPPQMLPLDNDENTGAAGWLILGFGVLYFIGAGLYFGLPLFKESPELLSVAGLVLLLSLPLILLLLLYILQNYCLILLSHFLNLQRCFYSPSEKSHLYEILNLN